MTTYNPLSSDIENNVVSDGDKNKDDNDSFFIIPSNSNFTRDLILNTLLPDIGSDNFIQFRGNAYSYFHRIHVLIVMILQFLLSSTYSNHKDNELFSTIIILANLNLIWLLIGFGVFTCTKNLENEIKMLKQVELNIDNTLQTNGNCNKLIIRIFEFWLILILTRLIEFISWMVSINGFINLFPYFFSNKDLTTFQITLVAWTIGYQLFIVDTITFRKLKIYL